MSRLPRVTARDLIRALKRLGFVEARQTGSHQVLKRSDPPARVVVPIHAGHTLKLGTRNAIIEDAGLSVEQLLEVL